MGKEDDPPITRLVFRIGNDDMNVTATRLETVLQGMSNSGRTKLAIAWDNQKKLDKLREVAEEMAGCYKILVAIHTKPSNNKTNISNRKAETEVIFVWKPRGCRTQAPYAR